MSKTHTPTREEVYAAVLAHFKCPEGYNISKEPVWLAEARDTWNRRHWLGYHNQSTPQFQADEKGRMRMKKIVRTTFACDICGKEYNWESEAAKCESVPIKMDRGAVIGSKVRILGGDGAGQVAVVESMSVVEPGWGPKQYDHTRIINAKCIESWGNRSLTYDSYELI